jgi:hypothetical protein
MRMVLLSNFLVIPGDLGVHSEIGGIRFESLRAAYFWNAPRMSPHFARLLAIPHDRHLIHIRKERGR